MVKFKSAVIVCHDWTPGPPHELRNFLLKQKIDRLLFIGHKNRYIKNNPVSGSYCQLYKNGILVKTNQSASNNLPEYIQYLCDLLLTVRWVLRYAPDTELYVGTGNFNALTGLLLKRLGNVRKVVYYVIDYIPKRFNNRVVNYLYHVIEKSCARYSDITWNYSHRMIEEREKHSLAEFPRQIVVPHGAHRRNSRRLPDGHALVYIGTLYRYQGVELGIRIISQLIKKIPDIKLHIIGNGPDRNRLEKLSRDLGVGNSVIFHGHVSSDTEADRIISGSAFGLALYRTDHPFVRYTDPGKIKRYLSCGIPVVTTLDYSQQYFGKTGICMIPPGDDSIAAARKLQPLLTDKKQLLKLRQQALLTARNYSWKLIFQNAFQETCDSI